VNGGDNPPGPDWPGIKENTMRTMIVAGMVVAAWTTAASAGLCPKCADGMYIQNIGKCVECGGQTSSGAFKLCAKCGDKLNQCQHCRTPLADKAAPAVGPGDRKHVGEVLEGTIKGVGSGRKIFRLALDKPWQGQNELRFLCNDKTVVELDGKPSAYFPAVMVGRRARVEHVRGATPWVSVTSAAETRPAVGGRPADAAAQRAAALKQNIDDFQLRLWPSLRQVEKPFYSLTLTRKPVGGPDRANPFSRWVQVSKDEALRIIDHLGVDGFLAGATAQDSRVKSARVFREGYVLQVSPLEAFISLERQLGWDLAMLHRLDALRKVLDGQAAKDMDLLLGRMSGLRKQWKAEGGARVADANAPARPVHKLPDGATAAVVTVDSIGGFRVAGRNDGPQLLVRADGTASVRSFDPRKRPEWKMPDEQLQSLLRDLIDELKVFELTSVRPPRRTGMADGATAVVRIEADGRKHEVTGPGYVLDKEDRNHERFLLVLRRLGQVQAVVALGGPEAAEPFLNAANAELGKRMPKASPFTVSNLRSGMPFANGNRQATFERNGLTATVLQRADTGKHEVSISGEERATQGKPDDGAGAATAPGVNAKEVGVLIEQLGAADFKVRESATEKLIALGESVRAPLEAKAREKGLDPEVASRIEQILDRLGGPEGGTVTDPASGITVSLDATGRKLMATNHRFESGPRVIWRVELSARATAIQLVNGQIVVKPSGWVVDVRTGKVLSIGGDRNGIHNPPPPPGRPLQPREMKFRPGSNVSNTFEPGSSP